MNKPAKSRVRRSFERAAPTYDSAAEVQRRICDRLLASLPAVSAARVLDAGCGTGYAVAPLRARFPAADILALDLSSAMLARCPPACTRLAGDLENLPLADASLDLYWSSLAVQWCELAAVLREAARCLRPGGQLAIATLAPGTFAELRHAFSGIDGHAHTLAFHAADAVLAIAGAAGFSDAVIETRHEQAFYPDFIRLLKAVKAVGANQLGDGRRTSLLSRDAFARAEAACERLRQPAGLPLTYDVVFLLARK